VGAMAGGFSALRAKPAPSAAEWLGMTNGGEIFCTPIYAVGFRLHDFFMSQSFVNKFDRKDIKTFSTKKIFLLKKFFFVASTSPCSFNRANIGKKILSGA
jgi:hypothetical protein